MRRLAYVTLLVVFVYALDTFTGGSVRGMVRATGANAWNAGSGVVRAIGSSGFFTSRRGLETQVEALRAQLDQVRERAALDEVLKRENESLRELVHLASETPGVTAPIVSSVYASPYGTFMIGAGTNEGIVAGSVVLSGGAGGFVVGRVVRADAHRSLVMQVFAPNASTEASVGGASITLQGEGGSAHASAPRNLSIVPGDPVYSPLFGGRVVGIVSGVRSEAASAEQTLFVALPVSLGTKTFVYVIPPQS